MTLPWGDTTVLGQVIRVLRSAGTDDILVVVGGARKAVQAICEHEGARTLINEKHATTDMLVSLQTGLHSLGPVTRAALITLGDQPGMLAASVHQVCQAYLDLSAPLVVPSYRMRRGHPWLVSRVFWKEILELRAPETPRDFLGRHALDIHYVDVDSPTILEDIDNPEDYLKSKP